MPTPNTLRINKDTVVAVAHQTAFATAGSSAAAQKWQATDVQIDPGYQYIHPRGTTGSMHPKDTHTKVAEKPKASVEVLGTPKVLPFLWEYATGGQPIATLANSDLSESGDTGNDLSAWSFTGVRPGFNTSSDWKLYVKLTDESPGAGQALVQVYSDSGRTALVASGSANNSSTVTLAEQNSSGLSGTVALATPSSSNLTGIVLTLTQVRPQWEAPLSRFFTLWRDHGSSKGIEKLTGCAIEKLTRMSEELGVVKYRIEILAREYDFDSGSGGTFTPALASGDLEYQVHGTTVLTSDVDSGAVAQHALKAEVEVENDLEQVVANDVVVSAILKKGTKRFGVKWTQKLSDESQVVTGRGISDSYESVRIRDAYATRYATLLFDKVKTVEPQFPKTGEDGWDEQEHVMEAVEETASNPTSPLTVTLML